MVTALDNPHCPEHEDDVEPLYKLPAKLKNLTEPAPPDPDANVTGLVNVTGLITENICGLADLPQVDQKISICKI